MNPARWLALVACLVPAVGLAAGCGGGDSKTGGSKLTGSIAIDGSSTVFPFAQAAAERFQKQNPGVKVTVGESGTGGGFEKFCAGETDITDASRPIEDDEKSACAGKGVRYSSLQVASDGISVVTNPALKITCMTTGELKKLWNPGSRVHTYRDLNPKFPDAKVSLFGAGTDSGTFDFFTEQINGEEGATRKDYQPSEDDNVLVQGVSGDQSGLGYFGFSYYEDNKDRLNLVGVDGGQGCVKPSVASVQSGEYKPLSRPLFMYPSAKAMSRPEVRAFTRYALQDHEQIAKAARIVPMSAADAARSRGAFKRATQ